jgi:stress-induced morphogen
VNLTWGETRRGGDPHSIWRHSCRHEQQHVISDSNCYELSDPVTDFEALIQDILASGFDGEGETVKVQHRTTRATSETASVTTSRTSRTAKLSNNLSSETAVLTSCGDAPPACHSDTVVTVGSPSFHGLSLVLQHDRVWTVILHGLLAEEDAGTLNAALTLPKPAFVDHKHYSVRQP